MSTVNLNLFLLRSIPIDKHLKRYYISKYKHLVKHNGIDYANDKIKTLVSSIKQYISSRGIPSPGVRQNGWFKKLLVYSDAQPHNVLNFLKGLTSWTGKLNVDKASAIFDKTLRSISSNHPIPRFMSNWIKTLFSSISWKRKLYFLNRSDPWHKYSSFHSYTKHHSLDEWMEYWTRMWNTFVSYDKRTERRHKWKSVFPENYKDYGPVGSKSFERDLVNFLTILNFNEDLPSSEREFMLSSVSPETKDVYYEIMFDGAPIDYSSTDFMSGHYVGDIHYIPKDGTGFRPIAVPNRFIQSCLNPIYHRLYQIVDRIPVDATFDQNKFDSVITSRVTTDSRFVGSVDMSKATENLPLDWVKPFLERIQMSETSRKSLELFYWISRAQWNNDGFMSRWNVGQPLGSLPSFMVLSITHNILVESLSLSSGYGHSPYRILGDDIVFFARRLRNRYIAELGKRGIPLSLHKSYSGRLTEFAGKIYVKKCIPFYTPDHKAISWASLFDWQVSSGIRIPWNNLPKRHKSRLNRIAQRNSLDGRILYSHILTMYVHDRGSHHTQLNQLSGDLIESFYYHMNDPKPIGEGEFHTGIVRFQNMVVNVNDKPLEANGLFKRYIKISLPDWFKRKFRPTSTDQVIDTSIKAIREVLVG